MRAEVEALQQEQAAPPAEDDSTPGSLSKSTRHNMGFRALGWWYFVMAVLWVLLGIIVQYFVLGLDDPKNDWSALLPDLGATFGKALAMGVHFLGGSVITLLGVWQVWPGSRAPERLHLHRMGGRVFVICALVAACGGWGFFIQQRVLAGGLAMNIAFATYGTLVPFFSVMAYLKVKEKDIEAHRRYALRAFAMGIASFIYRALLVVGVDLGLLPTQTSEMHEPREDRSTWFFSVPLWNQLSNWTFFLVPLLLVEFYIRAPSNKLTRAVFDGLFVFTGAFLGIYTIGFIRRLVR